MINCIKVKRNLWIKGAKENKLKLNFNNSSLMDGWDMNKEHDNAAVILRKNGLYYLGIIDKKHKKILDNKESELNEKCYYEKMDYKQIALPTGVGGFVSKCFGTAQRCGWTCPQECLNSDGKIIIKDDEAAENLSSIIEGYNKEDIIKKEDNKRYYIKGIIEKV